MSAATKDQVTKSAQKKYTLSTPTDRSIVVERVVNASRDKVWRAYSEVDLIKQWWGRGNPLDIEKWEFEKGGHWRFVENSDGGKHGFEGRFREITPKDRISMTFEWDGMPGHTVLDTAEFTDLGNGKTKIVTTSLFFTAEERDGMLHSGMEGGMAQSYEALDKLLATL